MHMRKTLGSALAAAALAVLGSLTTASTASASTPPNPDHAVSINNYNSGKCLEIADWRTDDGAPARQWTCTGGANQKWYLESTTISNTYILVNAYSGKCLEVADWRTDNGAPIRQWTCTGGANQEWRWGDPYLGRRLFNYNSNLCLVTQGTDNGSPAFQYAYGGDWDDQVWGIVTP